MNEVAERAGVSKATMYCWWPTKETLALDTLLNEWGSDNPRPPRETGSLRADLLDADRLVHVTVESRTST